MFKSFFKIYFVGFPLLYDLVYIRIIDCYLQICYKGLIISPSIIYDDLMHVSKCINVNNVTPWSQTAVAMTRTPNTFLLKSYMKGYMTMNFFVTL